jgi:uncharacterized membrane protein YeaQ/YmgE (transglycosylase-associated protein family)
VISFLLLVLVASILGSIGAALAGRRQTGCLASIALGFIGALIGRWLATQMEIDDPFTFTIRSTDFPLLFTIVGAALFVAVLNLISGKR